MHHPIDLNVVARVVSSSLGTDGVDYRYQEDCGMSDTSTFVKLVNATDVHDTIIVSVATLVTIDKFDAGLLQHKFDQNIAFLQHPIGVKLPLCPTVLTSGKPSPEFGFSWVAYKHLDGWPLSSNWHQLQPAIRAAVVHNLATFTINLAAVRRSFRENSASSADYVGSVTQPRAVHLHPLAKERETMHCFKLQRGRAPPGSKVLAVDQVHAVSPVAQLVLEMSYPTVLAHLNLDPQNIWIDPFSGELTAILGWELAHFAPTWMASAPPPWLLNEKADFMLQAEKRSDPWKIWRPHFHHPSKNIGKEMKTLRQVWDASLRSSDAFKGTRARDDLARMAMRACFVEEDKLIKSLHWAKHVVSPASSTFFRIIFLRHNLALLVLAFVLVVLYTGFGGQMDLARMARGVPPTAALAALLLTVIGYCFTPQAVIIMSPKKAAKHVLVIESVLFKSQLPWLFGYTASEANKKKALEAVPCSPATSIVPNGVYIPNLMSRASTVAGTQ